MTFFGAMRAPAELIFGPGQRASLARVAARLGQRALLVTDQRLAGDAALLAMAAQLREAGLAVQIEGGTQPDIPVESAMDSAERARAFAPDLVIGIGGGSCMDLAKASSMWQIVYEIHGGLCKGLQRPLR